MAIFVPTSVPGNLPGASTKSWFKRLAWLTSLFVLVAILFYGEENYRHTRAWRSYAQAAGLEQQRLNWRNSLPPPVPENQNFAKTPLLKAIGLKNDTDSRVLRRFTVFSFGNYLADAVNGTPTDLTGAARAMGGEQQSGSGSERPLAEVVLEGMKAIEPDLSELRSACRLPCAQFDASGQDPMARTIPNFVALRSLGQILSVQAGALLQQGQSAKALEDLRVILRLSDALKSHNTLVAAMIRVSLVNVALGPFREGCVSQAWSPTELAEFQGLLQQQDLLSCMAASMQNGERAGIHYIVEHYGPEDWSRLFAGSEKPSLLLRLGVRIVPRGWKYRALMLYDEPVRDFTEAIDPVSQRIDPVRVQAAFELVESAVRQRPYGVLAAVALPNFQRALLKTAQTQTMVDMAKIVCSLERYKAAHGGYPSTLQELAPDFAGSKLPHELVTGESFRYAMAGPAKFTLYSSGYDGKDDGGRTDPNPARGDWCWVN